MAEMPQLFDGFRRCGDDVTRAISRSATKTSLLDAEAYTHTNREAGGLWCRILLSTNVIDTDDRAQNDKIYVTAE